MKSNNENYSWVLIVIFAFGVGVGIVGTKYFSTPDPVKIKKELCTISTSKIDVAAREQIELEYIILDSEKYHITSVVKDEKCMLCHSPPFNRDDGVIKISSTQLWCPAVYHKTSKTNLKKTQ